MKPLPIVLGVLALVTAFPAWSRVSTTSTIAPDVGDQYLVKGNHEIAPDQIAGLRVVTWDDSAGMAKSFEVKKSGGSWIIPSHFDYPADGGTRVGKTAGGVLDIKRGRLVTSDSSQYEDLGVIDPLDTTPGITKGRGKRVTLTDQTGAVVVDLIIGNHATDGEDVCFVRQADGKDVYTAKINDTADGSSRFDISTAFVDWVETDLLKVKKDDLRKVLIVDYSVDADKGTINKRGSTALVHKGGEGDWTCAETPAGKRVSKETLDKLVEQITKLKLVGIRPFTIPDLSHDGFFPQDDPTLLKESDALILGVAGRPYALYSNEGRLDVVTKDGLCYSMVFGNVSVDDENAEPGAGKKGAAKPATGKNRFMTVFVRYDEKYDEAALKAAELAKEKGHEKDRPYVSPGQERAGKAAKRFIKFFYVISDESFQKMRPALEKLFEDKPKEPLAGSTGKTNSQWLAENGKKPGVVTTGSGLEYEVLSSGPATGRQPLASDEVSVIYKGTLIDGKVFDESGKNGSGPAKFRVNGVIKGWTEALQLMHEGDKWRLFIPVDLAYGEKGQPPTIGPNEILTFEVQLVKVLTPPAPGTASVAPAPAPAAPAPAPAPAQSTPVATPTTSGPAAAAPAASSPSQGAAPAK